MILDPKFDPDIIVMEECCEQSDLVFFNEKWLEKHYETVIVFPSNTDRHQNVALMAKKRVQGA